MEKKKIKICHLSSVHNNDDIRIFHKECVSLAKNENYDVSLITANNSEETVKGVRKIAVKFTVNNKLLRIYKTSKLVYQRAVELDADVYHFHDPELLPYGLKLRKKGKVVIYDAHEDVPRQIMGKPWIPFILRKPLAFIFELFENYIVKKLSFVIVSTPTIENRFRKIIPHCTAICNYPILKENMELPPWSSRKNEVCYVGGITKMRGIFELIDSLQYTKNVKLNLAGAFSPVELETELVTSTYWKNVNYFGVLTREGIIKLLNQSKVGIVTLHPQKNYLDSLPIKMFEYMYSGIPVIASDFPLWKEIVEENKCGICVNPTDPISISNGVRDLIENNDLAEQMGINGRKVVIEKYNWEIEELKLFEIYQSLLN
jgi:glycosyltransferase involved in cell wall biosynthesis